MKYLKIIVLFLITTVLIAGIWFSYKKFLTTPKEKPFKTQNPVKRTIARIVNAEGILEAQGYAKVGPLITGTVQKILVKNDENVTQGQLLAVLDNGKGGDSDVRQAESQLENAQAILRYRKVHYLRQKSLFQSGQLAQDTFEKITQDYETAKASVKGLTAAVDREKYIYSNTFIRSPRNGFILSTNIEEGETVSPISPATVMFEIAEDLCLMNVILKIDENQVGNVKAGQSAHITVDTYPNRAWQSPLITIGNAPMKEKKNGEQGVYYKAEAGIRDDENLLKPGMSVHAKITVAKSKDALALPGYVFQINDDAIKIVAKDLGYTLQQIDPAKRKELLKKTGKYLSQALWVVEGETFIEKVVDTGVTDNAYFEIVSGLSANDDVVSDVKETDAMKKLYKKFVGGGL